MTLAQINDTLATIDQIRQKVNTFIKAAATEHNLADALTLVAAITKDIATGGADPVAILQSLDALVQINADLTAAATAVKAEQPTA